MRTLSLQHDFESACCRAGLRADAQLPNEPDASPVTIRCSRCGDLIGAKGHISIAMVEEWRKRRLTGGEPPAWPTTWAFLLWRFGP